MQARRRTSYLQTARRDSCDAIFVPASDKPGFRPKPPVDRRWRACLCLVSGLKGKILVDVSNNRRVNQYPESNAEYLASLLPDSVVVKGFNVISAWTLQQSCLRDSSTQVHQGNGYFQSHLVTLF